MTLRLSPRPYRRSLPVLLLVLALTAVTAGCGTETRADVRDSTVRSVEAGTAVVPRPAAVPVVFGKFRTTTGVTVLDAGEGPMLCTSAVEESSPPRCSGHDLIAWNWADHAHQVAAGVRWIDGVELHGTFDGIRFTVTGVTEWVDDAPPPATAFESPCTEPAGGWQVVDPDATSPTTLDVAMRWATTLDGHTGAWLTRSPRGTVGEAILNVTTTGDMVATETELRRVWGGMLCVAVALDGHSGAELGRVMTELSTLPVARGASLSAAPGLVTLEVLVDDGSIQRWVDAEYGTGTVVVSPLLERVEEP